MLTLCPPKNFCSSVIYVYEFLEFRPPEAYKLKIPQVPAISDEWAEIIKLPSQSSDKKNMLCNLPS